MLQTREGIVMTKKNVFFIGLNDFNRERLRSIRNPDGYEFHGLLDPAEFRDTSDFPVEDMLRRAREDVDRFKADTGQSIDALTGYMDFPVSTMLPLLCKEYGTRSPSLESLLKCEHKYWSRLGSARSSRSTSRTSESSIRSTTTRSIRWTSSFPSG